MNITAEEISVLVWMLEAMSVFIVSLMVISYIAYKLFGDREA